jgi:hemerythrin-like domain-containing protein
MLPLHQYLISKQEHISKENTDIYPTKTDSSISDTLSGEYCTTDEDNIEEHTIRDTYIT